MASGDSRGRRNLALTSLGIPLGTLAVVAGCSGGGSVARTVPTAPAATQSGLKTGPTVPVTILVNPPKRSPSLHRISGSRKANYQLGYLGSGVLKIGVTVFAGSSTPSPAPTETVFSFPATGSTSAPTPYPITINVPVSSGDTFIINEYNGVTYAGPSNPNGYLLATYTSATPIPVYNNAVNHVTITTVPIASSATFSPMTTPFLENQGTAQSNAVLVTLLDVEGNAITGPVANSAIVTSTLPLVVPAGGAPVPQSTTVALSYPANSSANVTLTATVQGGFSNQYIALPVQLLIQPDFYLLAGASDNNVHAFDGLLSLAGTATEIGRIAIGSYTPTTLAGVSRSCGGYLAQAIVGVNDTGGGAHTVSVVNLTAPTGPLSVATASVAYGNTTGIVINPGSCTGYALSTPSSPMPAGNFYSLTLGAGGPTPAMISPGPNSNVGPMKIAVDNPATTLITSDATLGYLNAFTIVPPTNGANNNSYVGSPLALVEARGNIFQMVQNGNGYLYAYSNPGASGNVILSGTPFNAMAASPDGKSVFVATGSPTSTISYFNNAGALPTGYTFQSSTSATVTAMVVSPNNAYLFVAQSDGNVSSYPIASITSGFAGSSLMFNVPGTTSLAVSP